MKILGIDISLLFSIKDAANGGRVDGQAFEKTVDAVTRAREGFDRVFLACDSGPSFRKAVPEYKADRKDRGEVYRAQLQRTIERLKAEGCTVFVAPQVGTFELTGAASYAEADDVMGWAAEEYSKIVGPLSQEATADWALALLTDDSDMEQLIDDEARVYIIKTQTRGGEEWNEAKTFAERGVYPAKIADLKAFTGDDTDNYLGFCGEMGETNPPKRKPGIGPKGAASLIARYGGALETFDHGNPEKWEADGVPAAARATLARHGRAQAEKGLFLATIRRDLPGLDFSAILAEPVRTPITEPESIERAASWPKVEEAVVVAPPVPVAAPPSAPAVEAPAVSTALALPPPAALVSVDPSSAAWAMSLQPRSGEEAYHMAINLHASKLFVKKFESPEAIWTVMLLGREHGLSMLAALQSMHMIEGKVEMSAELIVAKILRSGVAKYFTLVESDDKHATWETHRQGEPTPLRMSFSVDDAQRRQIFVVKDGKRWTGNGKVSQWEKMPDVMCMWRCATKLARAKYPDVCRGLYGQGEIREMRDGAYDADFEDAA